VSRTDHVTHDEVAFLAPVAMMLWHTGAGTDTERLFSDDGAELLVVAALEAATATSAPPPTTAARTATTKRPRRAEGRDKL
jgi:hypothetical protein